MVFVYRSTAATAITAATADCCYGDYDLPQLLLLLLLLVLLLLLMTPPPATTAAATATTSLS